MYIALIFRWIFCMKKIRRIVFHQRVRIAVERDGRVLVSEQFGESPDVHAAFQRARGEGMTEGVESPVRYAQPRKQQRETPLIGAHGDGCLAVCYDEVALTLPLHLTKDGQELFRQRDHPDGAFRLGSVQHLAARLVVAGTLDADNAAAEIDVTPLQGEEFADAQPRVKADDNAVHSVVAPLQHRALDLLLLCRRETFHLSFRNFRALDRACRVVLRRALRVRRFQRALQHGHHDIHRACGKPRALLAAPLRQPGDEPLHNGGRKSVHIVSAQRRNEVYADDLRVTRASARLCREHDVVLQPIIQPFCVDQLFSSEFARPDAQHPGML